MICRTQYKLHITESRSSISVDCSGRQWLQRE